MKKPKLVRVMPATLLITSGRRHDVDLVDADAIDKVNGLLQAALKRRGQDPGRYKITSYMSPAAGLPRSARRRRA